LKTSLRLQVLAFTAARIVLNTMYRMVYPYLAFFSLGLEVDQSALSLAITARAAFGVVGPMLASVADSRGRKAGMLFGLLLFTVGAGLVAVWPTFPAFVLALVLTLLGKYAFDPAMQAYVGDRVPYERRGRVLAVTELGWSLSLVIGVLGMGLLINRYGWKAPFPILSIFGTLALVVLAWMLPRDPTPDRDQPGIWRNLRTVLVFTPALAGLILSFWASAANEVINLVFGLWMGDSFQFQIIGLGIVALFIGLSELGGETLAGILTDRAGKPSAIGAGLVLNSLAVLLLPFLGFTQYGALVGLCLFYVTFEFTLVSSIPMMTEIMPAARATLMAVNIAALSLGRALGSLIAHPLYEWGQNAGTLPEGLPGILVSALVVVLFNAFALLALRVLRRTITS
jgi:DHA1 family inner membrane transport protein